MNCENERVRLSPYLRRLRNNPNGTVNVMNHLTSSVHIIDKEIWTKLLQTKTGIQKDKLRQILNDSLFDEYLQKKIIVVQGTEWTLHQPRFIEIETTNICNWKCTYCPYSLFSHKKTIMSSEMFKLIMLRAQEYGHIRFISLHGYNEPTIDPLFLERAKMIKESGFQLVLYTNGSGLTLPVLTALKAIDVTRNIVFNFPSSNREVFMQRTGTDMRDRLIQNIHDAQSVGFRVNISIQGTAQEQADEIGGIAALFPDVGLTAIPSFDRAGLLKNKYCNFVHHSEIMLNGCSFVLTDIHISVEGYYYLCLEDYHKKNIFGNVKKHSFLEYLQSEKYTNYVKQIWGCIPANQDLLCRKCILLMNNNERRK